MTPYIIIATAVTDESSFLHDCLETPSPRVIGGRKAVFGLLNGARVALLATGPGQVNTVQALTALIESARPAGIIQTGCAGAFPQTGLSVGGVGIATEEIEVHLGIEPGVDGAPVAPLPFPVCHHQNKALTNRYPMDSVLVQRTAIRLMHALAGHDIQIVTGPFLTVSTITATDQRATNYSTHYQPIMEAMEGAAACHVALHYDIPFLEIRAASNLVGYRDRSAWDLPLAFERCGRAVWGLFQGDILEWIDN